MKNYRLADYLFSKFIRARDKKCQNPKCRKKSKELQCSHFWRRDEWIARYDEDNCITLCINCHYKDKMSWEHDKHGAYRDYMRRRIGVKRFDALRRKVMNARKTRVPRSIIIRKAIANYGETKNLQRKGVQNIKRPHAVKK